MDFKSFKDNALKAAKTIKDKTISVTDKTVSFTANKLASSSFTISSKQELDKFIKKSALTKFKNKETWIEKTYSHRVIIIFGEEKSDFFKKSLISLPVLTAKAFSQNVSIKLAKSNIKNIDLNDYNVEILPSMLVYENEKLLKVINWEKNILKLVKSLSLDINKGIEKHKLDEDIDKQPTLKEKLKQKVQEKNDDVKQKVQEKKEDIKQKVQKN